MKGYKKIVMNKKTQSNYKDLINLAKKFKDVKIKHNIFTQKTTIYYPETKTLKTKIKGVFIRTPYETSGIIIK